MTRQPGLEGGGESKVSHEGEIEPTRELVIDSILRTEYRSGIPLPIDFQRLAQALYDCAWGVGGDQKYRRSTSGFSPNPDVGMYVDDSFINDIIQKIRVNFSREEEIGWHENFDYVNHPFAKTSIKVDFDRENGALILGVLKSYTGKADEIELAEQLGVERAIFRKGVEINLPEMADQDLSLPFTERQTFRLDCVALAQVINTALNTSGVNEEKIEIKPADLVDAFTKPTKDKIYSTNSKFTVSLGGGLCLTIEIRGGVRFVCPLVENTNDIYNSEKLIDTRIADGTTVVLPFPTNVDASKPDFGGSEPPQQVKQYTLTIDIVRETKPGGVSPFLPMHTTEQLAKAVNVMKGILKQFPNNNADAK
ncbi:MAG: hypothetical protein HYV41_02295 [Candidatus Magasanikbacteria bacterium]|nr:hypothetical protein [Candidatus Magasanikbacteria bacterium]